MRAYAGNIFFLDIQVVHAVTVYMYLKHQHKRTMHSPLNPEVHNLKESVDLLQRSCVCCRAARGGGARRWPDLFYHTWYLAMLTSYLPSTIYNMYRLLYLFLLVLFCCVRSQDTRQENGAGKSGPSGEAVPVVNAAAPSNNDTGLVATANTTRQENETEKGKDVVDAVLQRFNETTFETDPVKLQFLRRIACVESDYGTNPRTFRDGYNGGIWQIDKIAFDDTQKTGSHRKLVKKHKIIKDLFGIDWIEVEWRELRKPLYSALGAWLYLSNDPSDIPETTEGQAKYWKRYILQYLRGWR